MRVWGGVMGGVGEGVGEGERDRGEKGGNDEHFGWWC